MLSELDSTADLIARFAQPPQYIAEGMIRIPLPAEPSVMTARKPASLAFGLLGKLPLELLHLVLNQLDLRSLSRFLQISIQGQVVVECLPAYRDLLRYARQALVALGRTRLNIYHTAAALHEALVSEKCVSCGHFGAFLHLPTCERVCYVCLRKNQSLWVISALAARVCFKLRPVHLKELPSMLSISSGHQSGTRDLPHKRRLRLFSVKAAKELAISLHGSVEDTFDPPRYHHHAIQPRTASWLRRAPLQGLTGDQMLRPLAWAEAQDDYRGLTSIPFPVLLPNNELEPGLWCRGCAWTSIHLDTVLEREIRDALSTITPPTCSFGTVLEIMNRRAWSKPEFLEHLKTCYGAQRMAAEGCRRITCTGSAL